MRVSRRSIILALIPLVIAACSLVGAFSGARNRIDDLLAFPQKPPKDVVIIAIDEQSIQEIGQWPWPRAVMARAIDKLRDAQTIGIDVNYKEASRIGTADDAALTDAIRRSSVPVILTSEIQNSGITAHPFSEFAKVSFEGFSNMPVDSDGIVRFAPIQRRNTTEQSFSSAVAEHAGYLTDTIGARRIRYYGPINTFTIYSFRDLINGQIANSELENRIVLIGATARDLQDYRQTPFGLTSGVEIQATIVSNIATQGFLKNSPALDAGIVLACGICAILLGLFRKNIALGILAVGGVILVPWIAASVMYSHHLLIDPFYPTISALFGIVAAIVARYLAAAKERRFIHDTFSRYLAPQVISELLRDPSQIRLGGQKRSLTILFSDIRSFTTLSERFGPEELIKFLNRYLSAMTNVILDHRGVVDKYIGDAIMAFWGTPLADSQHALHSLFAAVGMISALQELNRSYAAEGLPTIAIGIGLNTGDVTVGNVGSERRFDYTVIGDNVNLASRLEGLTKTYGVAILASEYTVAEIPHNELTNIHVAVREIDRVTVKGKTKPVALYEIMPPDVATRTLQIREQFDRARDAYYAGLWTQARDLFNAILAKIPDDGPTRVLHERCVEFIATPPTNWDGSYTMTHK